VTMDLDEHHRFLWNLSYRLTGSTADADEVVQETMLRCLQARPEADRPLRPWLAQVASRLSIDRLRERQACPYPGPWLPALVETAEAELDSTPSAEARYDLRESLTVAFLLALEVLSPSQRAVLVLRDVFDFSARETAEVLSLSEENVRQLHRRARQALEGYDLERCGADAAARGRSRVALERLLDAITSGDAAEAARVLRADVRSLSDGGGRFEAALVPLLGLERVFAFYQRLAQLRSPVALAPRLCNGLWTLETRFERCGPREAPRAVTGIVPGSGGVGLVFTQLVPEKLPRR
jgi:RNA polymerase sigma factor (sigma-70 family)